MPVYLPVTGPNGLPGSTGSTGPAGTPGLIGNRSQLFCIRAQQLVGGPRCNFTLDHTKKPCSLGALHASFVLIEIYKLQVLRTSWNCTTTKQHFLSMDLFIFNVCWFVFAGPPGNTGSLGATGFTGATGRTGTTNWQFHADATGTAGAGLLRNAFDLAKIGPYIWISVTVKPKLMTFSSVPLLQHNMRQCKRSLASVLFMSSDSDAWIKFCIRLKTAK